MSAENVFFWTAPLILPISTYYTYPHISYLKAWDSKFITHDHNHSSKSTFNNNKIVWSHDTSALLNNVSFEGCKVGVSPPPLIVRNCLDPRPASPSQQLAPPS